MKETVLFLFLTLLPLSAFGQKGGVVQICVCSASDSQIQCDAKCDDGNPCTKDHCNVPTNTGNRAGTCFHILEATSQAEVCNGVDDNCNGQVDENLTQACFSSCGVGTETCQAGQWVGCTAPPVLTCIDYRSCNLVTKFCGSCPSAPPEECNGLDDNCNGQVDENLSRSCSSACGSGTETCQAGQWVGCSAPQPHLCMNYSTCSLFSSCAACSPPPPEQCNGRDDNCNGQIDEGLTQACTSSCGTGTETCQNGQWVGCTAPPQAHACIDYSTCSQISSCGSCPSAPPEQCDGIDNNCNGQIDEGLAGCCNSDAQCPSSNACLTGLCDRTSHSCQTVLASGAQCSTESGCAGAPTCRWIVPQCALACPGTVIQGSPADCSLTVANANQGVTATTSQCDAPFQETVSARTPTSASWHADNLQQDLSFSCRMTNTGGTSADCAASIRISQCGVDCLQPDNTKSVLQQSASTFCQLTAPSGSSCSFAGQTVSPGPLAVSTQTPGPQTVNVSCTVGGVASTCSDTLMVQPSSTPPGPGSLPTPTPQPPPSTSPTPTPSPQPGPTPIESGLYIVCRCDNPDDRVEGCSKSYVSCCIAFSPITCDLKVSDKDLLNQQGGLTLNGAKKIQWSQVNAQPVGIGADSPHEPRLKAPTVLASMDVPLQTTEILSTFKGIMPFPVGSNGGIWESYRFQATLLGPDGQATTPPLGATAYVDSAGYGFGSGGCSLIR